MDSYPYMGPFVSALDSFCGLPTNFSGPMACLRQSSYSNVCSATELRQIIYLSVVKTIIPDMKN
jgi:hypothetical protein